MRWWAGSDAGPPRPSFPARVKRSPVSATLRFRRGRRRLVSVDRDLLDAIAGAGALVHALEVVVDQGAQRQQRLAADVVELTSQLRRARGPEHVRRPADGAELEAAVLGERSVGVAGVAGGVGGVSGLARVSARATRPIRRRPRLRLLRRRALLGLGLLCGHPRS